jgi:major vault protein
MAEERSGAKDLVLAPGEYAFIADDTKGLVDVCVGPYKMSLANTERPVVFSAKSKRFESAKLDDRQLSTIAPEGWYVVLKNPAAQNRHPTPAQRGSLPELNVGRKINIRGPASFALWPGQMAVVLKGHNLRSNQYLLVRVYDEDGARAEWKNQVMKPQSPTPPAGSEGAPDRPSIVTGTGGEPVGASPPFARTPINAQGGDLMGDYPPPRVQAAPPTPPDLTIGKMLIIKGTEVSFYIPPTGIEVVRDGEGELVREAVTLESLEYCVLLDENGKKRTERGPAVVFPEPTEVFVEKTQQDEGETPRKARKFRAIDLNEHSGVYVKVIAPYTDDTGEHQDGEELFITGKEQKFYFPREEHAIVRYGDRQVHYATAIPAGEGRYVLNRDTGDVRIERGPAMLLPDPRREVMCRRALDLKLVGLLYPGNTDALAFNSALVSQQPSPDVSTHDVFAVNALSAAIGAAGYASAGILRSHSLADTAEGRGHQRAGRGLVGDAITRPQGYTEPRTIMLNTRYQGVVTIDVWTGYAIKLVRPTGESRVVIGPKTALLEYDEQPQVLSLSKGTPKTHDAPIKTVYLCIAANRVSDVIRVETSDLVGIDLHVSYRVNFVGDPNKWFAVDNYVRVLCDRARSELRRAAIATSVEQFYYQAAEIVRAAILGDTADLADAPPGMEFPENGMRVYDVELSKIDVQADVKQLLVSSQQASIRERMELGAARRKLDHETIMQDVLRRMTDEVNKTNVHSAEIAKQEIERKSAAELQRTAAEAAEAEASAKVALDNVAAKGKEQELYLAQRKREWDAEHQTRVETQALHLEEVRAEVQAIVDKAKAVTPGLVEALNSFGERAMVEKVAQAMAPMSLIGAGSVMEVLGRMLEGTRLGKQLTSVANGAAAAAATNTDA